MAWLRPGLISALAAVLLSACTTTPPPDRDAWGNIYPRECSPEAAARVTVPVVRVSQQFLDRATKTPDRVGVMLPTGAVAVRNDLTGDLLADTLRHERCHLIMRELTGDPRWH